MKLKKKFLLILIILVFSLTVTACKKPGQWFQSEDEFTGTVVDITEKNNQTIPVEPGDKVTLTLVGVNGEGYQWSATPLTNNIMSLESHYMENFVPMNKGENFYSYWTFKVEREGETVLKFVYETPIYGEEPKETFEVTIVSSKENSNN